MSLNLPWIEFIFTAENNHLSALSTKIFTAEKFIRPLHKRSSCNNTHAQALLLPLAFPLFILHWLPCHFPSLPFSFLAIPGFLAITAGFSSVSSLASLLFLFIITAGFYSVSSLASLPLLLLDFPLCLQWLPCHF